MADIIQTRRDTAANWTTTDPILANGEIGLETDTNSMKVGNGVDSWTVLPYFFSTDKTFLDLTDTPLDYTGQALKSVLVKATEDGLEFGESGGGVFVGPVPPTDKVVTPIWFNTNTGKTLTWYEDADSKQWVQDVALIEPTNIVYSPKKNYIINPTFLINQREYVNGVVSVINKEYTRDRWAIQSAGQSLSFSGIVATITGSTMQQSIEDFGIGGETMTLSWEGGGACYIDSVEDGAAIPRYSPHTFTVKSGVWAIFFDAGTVSKPKLEIGPVATSFEYPDIATESLKCYRYYWSLARGVVPIVNNNLTVRQGIFMLPVEMVRVPDVSFITDNGIGGNVAVDPPKSIELYVTGAAENAGANLTSIVADAEL